MVAVLTVVWLMVLVAGWPFVRGHGHGWRLLVWLTLLFGFLGSLAWCFVRRGARLGAEAADGAS